MATEWYPTGNSHTQIGYDTDWFVLDVGSGHNPHPRADVLVDKFPLDNPEISGRSGRDVVLPHNKVFVVADATAMPFRDKSFDFVICSHVAEHIEHIDKFCSELNRIGKRGYLETPSKFAEILRHPPYHIWYVSNASGILIFEPAPRDYPLGWFGKLFFSLYFYKGVQLQGKEVFNFSYGCPKPWHYFLVLLRKVLVWSWRSLRHLTYTRFQWESSFSWEVRK